MILIHIYVYSNVIMKEREMEGKREKYTTYIFIFIRYSRADYYIYQLIETRYRLLNMQSYFAARLAIYLRKYVKNVQTISSVTIILIVDKLEKNCTFQTSSLINSQLSCFVA